MLFEPALQAHPEVRAELSADARPAAVWGMLHARSALAVGLHSLLPCLVLAHALLDSSLPLLVLAASF